MVIILYPTDLSAGLKRDEEKLHTTHTIFLPIYYIQHCYQQWKCWNRGYHEALKNRLTALAVVLEAQRNHPKQLASAYSAVTKNCREEAIKNAIIDAAEADPYQEDDDDHDDSSADLKGCFDQMQWLSSFIQQIFRRD